MQEQHIARLCKAGMSLILFEFTSALQQFLDGPASPTVLRVLKTFPRVVLVDGRAGFVLGLGLALGLGLGAWCSWTDAQGLCWG